MFLVFFFPVKKLEIPKIVIKNVKSELHSFPSDFTTKVSKYNDKTGRYQISMSENFTECNVSLVRHNLVAPKTVAIDVMPFFMLGGRCGEGSERWKRRCLGKSVQVSKRIPNPWPHPRVAFQRVSTFVTPFRRWLVECHVNYIGKRIAAWLRFELKS